MAQINRENNGSAPQSDAEYKITLPSGARIVYERLPYVRSAAMGLYVSAGSRDEPAPLGGISHFIEHMLFKSTEKRSTAEMAAIFDSIGGHANAYTTKDATAYYVRTLDEHAPLAAELLCDMLLTPRFDPSELATEKGVVAEEIGMYADSPDDLAIDKISDAVFPRSPMARPVLGTKKTIERFDGDALRAYMAKKYTAPNVVFSISGRFEDSLLDYAASRLAALPGGKKNKSRAAVYFPAAYTRRRAYEQNHLTLLFPGISRDDDDRFALALLNTVAGDGPSSRLFQSVRERQGLCYSVFSFVSSSRSEGILGAYAATSRENEQSALAAMKSELMRLRDEGITPDELARAKQQVKAGVLMSLESTSARSASLARNELVLGKRYNPDLLVKKYEDVTTEDVLRAARRVLDFSRVSVSAIGRVGDKDSYVAAVRD